MNRQRTLWPIGIRLACAGLVGLFMLSACGGGGSGPSAGQVPDGPTNLPTDNPNPTPTPCSDPSGIEGGGIQIYSGVMDKAPSGSELQLGQIRFSVSSAQVYFDGASSTLESVQPGNAVVVAGTVDINAKAGCAEGVFADADVTGRIDAIDRARQSMVVVGQEVRIDADTVFGPDIVPGSLNSLLPGDRVRVSGVDEDDAVLARRIDRAAGAFGYRFSGPIQDHDAARRTFRIRQVMVNYDQATLSGLPTGVPRDGDLIRVVGAAFDAVDTASGEPVTIHPTLVEYIDYGTPVVAIPTDVYIKVGTMIQFTPASGEAVTWSVSSGFDEYCDPADCGFVDSSGRYFAPLVEHVAPGLLVTATSVATPSQRTTFVVFVYGVETGISVSPTSVTLDDGAPQAFAAVMSPNNWLNSDPEVAWSARGPGCAGIDCGTIDADGVYTPPKVWPAVPLVTVTATLVSNPRILGSATVHLGSNPYNARLKGQYAYQLVGYDGDGYVMAIGSFEADGAGRITRAVQHSTHELGGFRRMTGAGVYSVNEDNRGSMTLSVPVLGVRTIAFALRRPTSDSSDGGQMSHYSDTLLVGELRRQDPTAFAMTTLQGDYAFGVEGEGISGYHLVANGRFTLGGTALDSGQADAVDHDKPAPTSAFTGEVSAAPNEFGEMYLQVDAPSSPAGGQYVAFVVSRDEWLLAGTSSPSAGRVLRQSGGPFSQASLNGNGVLCMAGKGLPDRLASTPLLALQHFDGNGGLTGSVMEYQDDGLDGLGTVARTVSGAYSVDANGLGRGSMMLSGEGSPFPLYLVDQNHAFVIDPGSRIGLLERQGEGAYGPATFYGDYALGMRSPAMNWWMHGFTGVLTPYASWEVVGSSDGAVSGQTLTGDFFVGQDGRMNLELQRSVEWPYSATFYFVSPSRAIGIATQERDMHSGCHVMER